MAEDEENISDFVSRGLKNFDYEVTVVDNGNEAWRLLETGSAYDLVMLDIRMPGMSGLKSANDTGNSSATKRPFSC